MTHLSDKCREIWTEAYRFRDNHAMMGDTVEEWCACADDMTLIVNDKFNNDPEAIDVFSAAYAALERDRGHATKENRFTKVREVVQNG